MIKEEGKKADDNSRFFSIVRFSACLNLSRSIWGDGLNFHDEEWPVVMLLV